MLYAEDLHEGQEFPLASYTLAENEILNFAREFDPAPIHTDPIAAADGPFGGIIASSLHTMAIYQRLIVGAMWSGVAGIVGRSFQIRMKQPVRPGTTLTGCARITRITHRPDRHDAVVLVATDITTRRGACSPPEPRSVRASPAGAL
jgi:acyl dehydratase